MFTIAMLPLYKKYTQHLIIIYENTMFKYTGYADIFKIILHINSIKYF